MRLFTISVLFCFCTLMAGTARAQCIVDNTLTAYGITPDVLPDAVIGEPYYQVIQIVMPRDTIADVPIFGNIHGYFCSFSIKNISNAPSGVSYEVYGPTANQSTDSWGINHLTPGYVNRGCVEIKGTPGNDLSADGDKLKITVKYGVTLSNPANNNGNCNANALLPSSTDYELTWNINAVSIDPSVIQRLGVRLAPNPAQAQTQLIMHLAKPMEMEIAIYDLAGKKVADVFEGRATEGGKSFDIPLDNLANGMYFVRVTADQRTGSIKLMVNN